MKTLRIPVTTKPLLVFIFVLALLLLVHGYGAEWPVPPPGQPAQMWSRVDYDPKLTDPFYKSNEWSYPDGSQVVSSGMWPEGEDPPRLKHTAKCYSTSSGVKHLVRFCEAKLLDLNMIDLLIHESNPAFDDRLRVQIRNGMFTCQYWTASKVRPRIRPGTIWTTKRQKLTLDKKACRTGDVIKGRIDFECVQEPTNPAYIEEWGRNPRTIKVHGVFKTIVE